MGVKCSWTRGWASGHFWTTGALCADRLSQITWMAGPGPVCRSIWSRKSRKSIARCWADSFPITVPVAVFSAANRSIVPCRNVVVTAPLGDARQHRQHWRGPLQCLDLRFFVHREDRRVGRRSQIQAHHVADLVDEQRVRGDLEVFRAPWLQPESPPDPVHARRGDAHLPGQFPLGPVGGPFGDLFQGADHHLLHLGIADRARHPRPRLIAQAVQPAGQEPGPPLGHRAPVDLQPRGHRGVAAALGARQHDPRPQRQPLRGLPAPGPVLQPLLLGIGQDQRLQPRITHAISRSRAEGSRHHRDGS